MELNVNPDSMQRFNFLKSLPVSNRSVHIISLQSAVKAVNQDLDFIYTVGSVLNERAAAVAVIDNNSSFERLPDKSSTFSAELYAL